MHTLATLCHSRHASLFTSISMASTYTAPFAGEVLASR